VPPIVRVPFSLVDAIAASAQTFMCIFGRTVLVEPLDGTQVAVHPLVTTGQGALRNWAGFVCCLTSHVLIVVLFAGCGLSAGPHPTLEVPSQPRRLRPAAVLG